MSKTSHTLMAMGARFYHKKSSLRIPKLSGLFLRRALFNLLIVLISVFFFFFVVYLCWPRASSYTISATTESVSFQASNKFGIVSALTDFIAPDETIVAQARLQINPGTVIEMTRQGNGGFSIEALMTEPEAAPVPVSGHLISTDGTQTAFPGLVRIDQDPQAPQDVFLFPFQASHVSLGRTVGNRGGAVLLSGTVTIMERTPFGRRLAAEKVELDPGDHIIFGKLGSSTQAWGFVHVGGGDALRVTVHTAASEISVIGMGHPEGYSIRPSPWTRVTGDPFISTTLIVLAVVSPLLLMLDLIVRFLQTSRRTGSQ